MNAAVVPFFIVQQGCRHRCSFCDQRTIAGRDDRLPTAAQVRERVAAWGKTAGGPVAVAFYGGSFTRLAVTEQEALLAAVAPLRASGAVTAVHLSTRPDSLDDATLARLCRGGVTRVELGVQSLDDHVLARAERGHDSACVAPAVAMLRAAGLQVGIQLLPGLPGESHASARRTLAEAIVLAPDFLRIYPALVLANTPLAESWRRGEYCPLSLEEGVAWHKVLLHDALRAGIPVVRYGLQAVATLTAPDTVLAGPWHPAFRQLLQTALWFDLASQLSQRIPARGKIRLVCHPRRLPEVVGQRRVNLHALQANGITVQAVTGDASLADDELLVVTPLETQRGRLRDGSYPTMGRVV